MTKSIIAACNGTNPVLTTSTTYYLAVANHDLNFQSTETNAQAIWRTPGTFSDMYVKIPTNGSGAILNFTLRVNGVDSAMTIQVPVLQAGDYVESVPHTVHIAAGDKVSISFTTGQSGVPSITIISVIFTPDTATDTVSKFNGAQAGLSTASYTTYNRIQPTYNAYTITENLQAFKFKKAGTMRNLSRYNTAIRATATTFRTRKNAANGAQTLTVSGTAPLWFEDTVNYDTIAIDDTWNYQIVTGAGTDTELCTLCLIDFVSTNGDSLYICGSGSQGTSFTKSTTGYEPLNGFFYAAQSVESKVQMQARVGSADGTVIFSSLSALIVTNTTGANNTVDFRVNAASGNQSITVDGTTTGWVHDVTVGHTDTITDPTALLNYRVVNTYSGGGTHSLTLSYIATYMNITGAAARNIVKTITEAAITVGAGTGAISSRTKNRSFSETAISVGAGTAARQAAKNRAYSEVAITVTHNTPERVKGKTKSYNETAIVVGEQPLARQTAKNRSYNEAAISVGAGTGNRQTAKSRSISETAISIGASIPSWIKARSIAKSITETAVSIGAGTADKVLSKVRTITETAISVSDSLDRLAAKSREIIETPITISDSVFKVVTTLGIEGVTIGADYVSLLVTRINAVTKTITETAIQISDSIDIQRGKVRNASDSISVSDQPPTRQKESFRQISEPGISIGAGTATRGLGRFKTLSESAIVIGLETITRKLDKLRSITESAVSIGATANRTAEKSRSISESAIQASHNIPEKTLGKIRNIQELQITVLDSVQRLAQKTRAITEVPVAISGSADYVRGHIGQLIERSITEAAITVSDNVALSKTRNIIKTITESAIVVGEQSLTRLTQKFRSITEPAVTATGTAAKTKAVSRSVSDSGPTAISDLLSRMVQKFRAPAIEAVSVGTGIAQRTASKARAIEEQAITISDYVFKQITKAGIEGVTIGADYVELVVSHFKQITKSISEPAVSIGDGTANRIVSKNRSAGDNVSVGTGVANRIANKIRTVPVEAAITVSDAVSQVKTVATGKQIVKSIIEAAITVSDYVDKVVTRVPGPEGGQGETGIRWPQYQPIKYKASTLKKKVIQQQRQIKEISQDIIEWPILIQDSVKMQVTKSKQNVKNMLLQASANSQELLQKPSMVRGQVKIALHNIQQSGNKKSKKIVQKIAGLIKINAILDLMEKLDRD